MLQGVGPALPSFIGFKSIPSSFFDFLLFRTGIDKKTTTLSLNAVVLRSFIGTLLVAMDVSKLCAQSVEQREFARTKKSRVTKACWWLQFKERRVFMASAAHQDGKACPNPKTQDPKP